MVDQNSKKQGRLERIRKDYHLIIRNQDTFEDIYNIKLNLLNVYIMVCTILVVVGLIVLVLLAFTPLKTYIPGYGDIKANAEYKKLLDKMNQLEKTVEMQTLYVESVRRRLTNDVEYASYGQVDTLQSEEELNILQRIPEDDYLRQKVGLEDRLSFPLNDPDSRAENGGFLRGLVPIAPVNGYVSLEFDIKQKHFGVDIIAPENSPVKAALPGVVISSGWNLETGNTLAIQHPGEIVTFYKHNANLLKKTGDFVQSGDPVAIIGNTGMHTDGPHLHFEIWQEGQPLNPMDFIRFTSNK